VSREVRYARSGELSIAYQTVGSGGPDLLFVPGFVSHLDLAWEEPSFARFLRGLAEISRVIWFDKRGTGLSDPTREPSTVEGSVDDLRAVLDAVGSRRATLFGVAVGAGICTSFALRHPGRVRSLVLWGAHARLLRAPDYPAGWTDEFFASVLTGIDRSWATGSGIEAMNPTLAGDDRFRSWFVRHARAAASPAQARELFHLCAGTDLRPLLPEVRAPTLLLHRRDDPWLSIEHSRYVVSRMPDAKLVELPGPDHWPWIGDADPVLIEVEAFLTGVRRRRRGGPAWGPASLTRRERRVVDLAVHGYSAREIGERLLISERTVETHIAHVYRKLGVASRLELARVAADHAR
jgi:pimeloyl-ACP methyl ester carboxylesterase/DNA-binding CsgD family transcriptional regulator